MFLLCMGESHKRKRELASCFRDIKHVDLCNLVYKPRELEKNWGSKATMLASYLINYVVLFKFIFKEKSSYNEL